jgi:hypothetical protein
MFSGAELRDQGMQQATDHADAVNPKWSETAHAFLLKYAKGNEQFTAEDVRNVSHEVVPTPPDQRAWGGVMVGAVKSGMITKCGYAAAKNPKNHCGIATLWKSNVYQEN